MATKQQRGLSTVEALLDGAMAVYHENGAEGFTLTAVLDHSGVSVGSLYHHFGSFEGLSATLYVRCAAELLEEVHTGLIAADNPRDGVHNLITSYLRWAAANPDKAQIVHSSAYAGYFPASAVRLPDDKAPSLDPIIEWFVPHVMTGRIQPVSPVFMEMLIIGPVAITVRRWLSDVPGVDLDEAAEVLPERVWQSVRGPKSA